MSPKILIAEPRDFSPAALAELEAWAEVVQAPTDRAGLAEAFQRYDAVWMRLAQRVDAALLGDAPRARALACAVTGLDHIDLEACAARGVKVVSLKGEVEFLREVRATAELTLGLALALLRRLPAAAAHVEAGGWDRDRFRGRELYKKTAGVVGVGRLGEIVAGTLQALGMEVIGYDPRPDFPPHTRRAPSLEALLAEAELVTLHVSYSPETHHLLGPEAFAAMLPGAVLINTSRGGLIDEAALLAALDSGRLAGAALDVLEGEPETATHPLVLAARGRDDLLIVPHIGGNTYESFQKTERFIAQRLKEALCP